MTFMRDFCIYKVYSCVKRTKKFINGMVALSIGLPDYLEIFQREIDICNYIRTVFAFLARGSREFN